MKKFFSLMIALVAALAINADNYYIGGVNNSWPEPGTNPAYQLTGDGDVLSATFAKLESTDGLKVFIGEGWSGNELGKSADTDTIIPNGIAVTLTAGGGNVPLKLADKHYLKDATVSLNTTTLALTVTGTDVDGSQEADVYCLVGACTNNWAPADAVEFVDVEGVLTATVPSLNGGFKIIKNHKWGWEAAAAAGETLALNTPMTLVTSNGNNITLANPFGGYNNAVVTLDLTNEDAPVITLVGGEFALTVANWYMPGSKLGWNCNETTQFEAVEGQENTYELLMAEFGKDFKVVYGVWNVEFGGPKSDAEEDKMYWVANEPMELVTPCNNVYATDNDVVLNDVTATIVVDYENVAVTLTLAVEATALEEMANQPGVQKVIENGQLVIIKNGVRYTAKGAKL